MDNKYAYAKVHVILDDGEDAEIYIGGEVEVFYHHERIKAYVKRNKSKVPSNDKEDS